MFTINEQRFLDKIRKAVGKGINKYNLINSNDKIAVGMSGGKDSLILLETLALRRNFIPIDYELYAVHINIKNIPYEIDRNYISNFCNELNVPLIIKDIEIDFDPEGKKSTCFVCSWNRRKKLFHTVKDLGCNKLALGHHMDDAVETLLLNMVFNSSISSIPPGLSMFNGEFDIIRPLILVSEKNLKRYNKLKKFAKQKKECPYGDKTRRADIKKIILELEKLNKKARTNLFWSMSHLHEDYLLKELDKNNE